MNISIINSRLSPTVPQLEGLRKVLSKFSPKDGAIIFHGADKPDLNVHSLARSLGYLVVGYPHHSKQKTTLVFNGIDMKEPKPLNERNPNLVSVADIVIALPQMFNEWEDSPHWKTIRFAMRNEKKRLFIVSSQGNVYEFIR